MNTDPSTVLGNVLGAAGVAMLLLAFVLNASGRVRVSFLYTYLNLFGAALAGIASAIIGFVPFIILESVWCMAAAAKLVSLHRNADFGRLPNKAKNSMEP